LDDIGVWLRYDFRLLCGTDVLSNLIQMALCRGIRFSKIFANIVHRDGRPCCKVAILNGLNPCVCDGAETARMQICYGVFYGFLFINIVSSVFQLNI
jgi:hypothetical protein